MEPLQFGYGAYIRPTCNLFDYNGDGLLDIVATLHATVLKGDTAVVNVYLNSGTPTSPKFEENPSDNFSVSAGGTLIKSKLLNILFADINNDNKEDLFVLKCKFTNFLDSFPTTCFVAYNVSQTDSAIFGALQPLTYNNDPIEFYTKRLLYGNKQSLAFYDINNDNFNEFYINQYIDFNSDSNSYVVYTGDSPTTIDNNKTHIGSGASSCKTFLYQNSIDITFGTPATEITLYNSRGCRVYKNTLQSENTMFTLNVSELSSGVYLIRALHLNGNYTSKPVYIFR